MSGSSGSQRASRSRSTPNSPGASTRGARSPIRVVADPVGACSRQTIVVLSAYTQPILLQLRIRSTQSRINNYLAIEVLRS